MNLINSGYTDQHDQSYHYDLLNRRKSADQKAGHRILGSVNLKQAWGLDQLGNWSAFQQDGKNDYSAVYNNSYADTADLDQTRKHNAVNEIDNDNDHANSPSGTIANGSGQSAWALPAYDASGNMTSMPKPKALGSNYTVKYDAWNRLSTVADGSTVVQTNRYDGLHRRVSRESNTTGVRHFYWNESWQCVEERVGSSTTADRQYVWHPYYIDALAISYNSSGTAHYYVQDGNFNVTAAMDSSGTVVERYSYTPYGECIVLNADFTLDSSSGGDGLSDISNEFTYTGRRLDGETGLYQYRHRYYHAGLGRFVNRDPIGYEDGMSVYCNYFSPGNTDPQGTLRFANQTPPANRRRECGDLLHKLTWVLDRNERDGIVIQKVCYYDFELVCPGLVRNCVARNRGGGFNQMVCPSGCYYEYWKVGRNGFRRNANTDTFMFPACYRTHGFRHQRGYAFFVSDTWIRNNGFHNTVYDGTVFGIGGRGVARAGSLPSACSENAQAYAFGMQHSRQTQEMLSLDFRQRHGTVVVRGGKITSRQVFQSFSKVIQMLNSKLITAAILAASALIFIAFICSKQPPQHRVEVIDGTDFQDVGIRLSPPTIVRCDGKPTVVFGVAEAKELHIPRNVCFAVVIYGESNDFFAASTYFYPYTQMTFEICSQLQFNERVVQITYALLSMSMDFYTDAERKKEQETIYLSLLADDNVLKEFRALDGRLLIIKIKSSSYELCQVNRSLEKLLPEDGDDKIAIARRTHEWLESVEKTLNECKYVKYAYP